MKFCVGRLTLRQLYGCDPETPYVSFMIIAALFDNFRRHPVRSPYEGILLRGQRARQLAGDTKVGEFHFSPSGKENIRGCGKGTVLGAKERSSTGDTYL